EARRIEQAVEQPGSMAKKGELLLQIDVDAAEKDALLADIRLVGRDRCIRRNEQRIVALALQLGDERVVVHAAAAVHPGGAGGDVGDAHGSPHETINRRGDGNSMSVSPLLLAAQAAKTTR